MKGKLSVAIVTLFFTVLSLGFLSSLVIIVCTASENKMYLLDLCFTSECVLYVNKELDSAVKIFNVTISLLTSIATIGGITIAVKSYLNVASSNALNNHISHFKIFQDYMAFEVGKRDKLSLPAIDVFKWYNLIFTNSRAGTMDVSSAYVSAVNIINNEILTSNCQSQNAHEGSYRYKEHQKRIRTAVNNFGISLGFHPRNDFHEIETQILNLISTINKAFCSGSSIPEVVDRDY